MPPVYPLTIYTPEQMGHYPHMAKRDAEVWEDFLRAFGSYFVGFSYDVALGGAVLQLPGIPDEELKGWQYSTALKIDAVGWMGTAAWIIEVRPDATTSALGSALTYSLVAKRDALTDLPLVPCVVCRGIQPDVAWACARIGVQVVKVANGQGPSPFPLAPILDDATPV